jgi:hypothetical protein
MAMRGTMESDDHHDATPDHALKRPAAADRGPLRMLLVEDDALLRSARSTRAGPGRSP